MRVTSPTTSTWWRPFEKTAGPITIDQHDGQVQGRAKATRTAGGIVVVDITFER